MPAKSMARVRNLISPYVWREGQFTKMRTCRRCLKKFKSKFNGNRICDSCSSKPDHYDVKDAS